MPTVWSPLPGTQPSMPATRTPHRYRALRGPGTLVVTPIVLSAKKSTTTRSTVDPVCPNALITP